MKDKPNEWVSIADLMAGVMAVVMLLLVMAVLQKSYSDLKYQQEQAQSSASQRQKVEQLLGALQDSLNSTAGASLVALDLAHRNRHCVTGCSVAAVHASPSSPAKPSRASRRR